MRTAFINTLIKLAETDKDLYLLTADMGFGLVEPFAEKFPERYINVGVAEQNMIGVATGLALEGKKVFCYSIGNFPTMRCLEQIRNDVCYHNLPVCIVSGGAGLWYGALGMTHHAVEDVAVMRCLPNMAVVSPSCPAQIELYMNSATKSRTPCYLRISRNDNHALSLSSIPYLGTMGIAYASKKPSVLIIATGGTIVGNAIRASQFLEQKGIRSCVWDISVIKPLLSDFLLEPITTSKLVLTIEEHSRIGGLGSAIAEVLAGLKQHPPLVRLGTADNYPTTAMSYEELLKANHLDVDGIVKEVLDALS